MQKGFTGGSMVKESAFQCRRCRFNPYVRKIPGEGNGNSLKYSRLENLMDRGICQATVHQVTKTAGHELETKQQPSVKEHLY